MTYEPSVQNLTFDASNGEILLVETTTKNNLVRRWILAMFIGSVPILTILFLWILTSIVINNVVRYYYKKKACRERNKETTIENQLLSTAETMTELMPNSRFACTQV
ncbi:unnamed protein product [Didymodactylos carnosus]|uniref:Uncharacterized protein n=1 Tax=Didymodactylos carnosus TaxID=1234261 RepID=A0A814C183_9BILA|nr:unnamed protein product [Didymodactylos carnosus]CAF0950320.1 unnamed protein product [Didymodactylos carnosus]CAF3714651.1 unnamed protein product [Didymodactylos carnosus]CAF3724558.1 unnamed protein product [Didymodactylos carnosus]